MRFRFCGDLDCPDWILAEINTLARMSSVKMKILTQHIAKSLLGENIDHEKIRKLTADAKFEPGDVQACIAALAFVLESSSKHGVAEEALGSELQQLGLPKEHSAALCKVHSETTATLTEKLKEESLRLNTLVGMQWRVNLVSGTSNPEEQAQLPKPEINVGFQVRDPATDEKITHDINMSPMDLKLLIADLKRAATIMEPLESLE